MKHPTQISLATILLVLLIASSSLIAQKPASKTIDDSALRSADARQGEWLTHGRNYAETRFSTLNKINDKSVQQLGLAWAYDTNTMRGLEASPIIANGVMYTTGSWSVVYALDARTGKQIWKYDPEVPKKFGAKACCDVVNRGVALYKGKVFVGTLDGRLIALDAATGKVVWNVVTVDQTQSYTITGAPRVVKGKVLIGNGGGEYGVRGYITAYDAETGKQSWRFYVVPGDPAKGFESKAMERAAKTWDGEWWKLGGGGTVWDSMAYDPGLNLLYVGTGNGSPWNQQIRSPKGGDNLYLSSIVALRPETGAYVWHYQTTPGDTWDYTATQHIILADLKIGGRVRKVLMQAPKNGFFYVLDRATGQLISAEAFAEISWAKGIDKKTGRPIEIPEARYKTNYSLHKPGPLGAHNWQPMSFNPMTGLVYIPAQDIPGFYSPDPKMIPPGHLLAWDPIKQKEAWRVPYKMMWNGGTLTTAGNLVFQGTSDGRFVAYSADKGEKLWEVNVGIGIIAPPVTYQIDGVQYITVMSGWGGAFPLTGGYSYIPELNTVNVGRVLTFALNAKQELMPLPKIPMAAVPAIESNASAEVIAKGNTDFAMYCAVCHGAGAVGGGGLTPMLPTSNPAIFKMFDEIVLDGSLEDRGMPGFGKHISKEDSAAIRAYLLKRRADILAGK